MEDAIVPLIIIILVVVALIFLVGYAAMGFVGWGIAGLIAFIVPLGVATYRVLSLRNPFNLACVVVAHFDGTQISWRMDERAVKSDWVLFGSGLGACAAFVYAAIVNSRIFQIVQLGPKDDPGLLLFWWWILTLAAIAFAVWRASKIMSTAMIDGARQLAANLSGGLSIKITRARELEMEVSAISAELGISPLINLRAHIQGWIDAHKDSLIANVGALDGEIAQAQADAQDLRDHLKRARRIYELVEKDYVASSSEVARCRAHLLMPVLEACHKRMLSSRQEFLPHRRWNEFMDELEEISEELAEIRDLVSDSGQSFTIPSEWDGEWKEPQTIAEKIAKARKILDITDDATIRDIEHRYKGFSRAFHPDQFRGDGIDDAMYKRSEERYKRINWAYSVLTGKFDPEEKHV
ncbi:MAG TPA: hypothetical protein VGQ95_09005 [Chthoniobacterales bacterium]|nr:hypothetical protein [Chthoniobacterales bacterium]